VPNFYVPPENIKNNSFEITGSQVHHLARVRRCSVGSELDLFDGTGRAFRGKIENITKDKITGVILEEQKITRSGPGIQIFQAVPRGERLDWLVEKASELGIAGVIPTICERSLLKEISEHKLMRWRRLSESACQQCGRHDIMAVGEPQLFGRALESLGTDELSLIAWESEGLGTIQKAFKQKKKFSRVNIFIGPEGGFEAGEVGAASKRGAVPVTLGKRVLRVETAGIVASVLALNECKEFE
jgi:16S rRNA (uracil1498-N3)-methyltransferase